MTRTPKPPAGSPPPPAIQGRVSSYIEFVSRVAFGFASVVLVLMALALIGYGAVDLFVALGGPWRNASDALLRAIGYVVIAVAVFDVAKYFVEEEVIRAREMRLASEARRSLTKFISTITIAVFIEGVVTVFQVSKDQVDKMLFPTALLVAGILMVIGLGVYQRLSAEVERQVGPQDRADARAEARPQRKKRNE